MTAKQLTGLYTPDGSQYVTLTDGAGNLVGSGGVGVTATVTGNVASGATDSGNPAKVGGVYNTSKPVLTTGQRGDLQLEANGSLDVSLYGINGNGINVGGPADANIAQNGLFTVSQGEVYNGATWDRVRGNTNGAFEQGNVASGIADVGNPVKVGGVFNSSPLALTSGQRGDIQITAGGTIKAALYASNDLPIAIQGNNLDNLGVTGQVIAVNSNPFGWNGSSWDRLRNNTDTAAALISLTTSASGTFNSADQTNYNGRGLQLGVNITATIAQTLQVTVQGKDIVSGQYYTVGGGTAALASTGFTNVTIYPGITTTANLDFAQVLPRTWRVQAVVSGAGSTLSATVGASVIL